MKTRHASRAVLNAMRDDLSELKEDGKQNEKISYGKNGDVISFLFISKVYSMKMKVIYSCN